MVKKGQKKSILSSALITVFIVIMLIISGPAQAVSVKIADLDSSYTSGSSISFKIKIDIEDLDQYVPITNISLDLTGPSGVNKKSTFYLNGTPIPGGDSNISISPDDKNPSGKYGYGYGYGFDDVLDQGTDFGYGYGYGYGYSYGYGVKPKLEYDYDVTIDTTSLPVGSYSMVASLNTGRTEKPAFSSETETFDIVASGGGTSESIPVSIEIKPETINPKSNGEITVTIFNNDSAGFDVGNLNISTVRFGPNGAAPFWNNTPADKKLMLKFYTNDTGIQCGDTQATLTGKTYSEQDIVGTGSFRTRECSIDVPLSTDESGITNTTVTRESPSGNMTITIPAGTRALKSDGTPLSNITVTSLADLPSKAREKLSSRDRSIGELVELEPSGSTFVPPIRIRFNYTEPLPSGVSESSLQIRTYNETTDTWETLPIVERNTEENYIIANVSHFSTFALIGTVPEESSSGSGGSSGSTGGSGGSTGGGGVISSEPFDNIARVETVDRDLLADRAVKYTYSTLGLYEIDVTGGENENAISIRVEELKGTSTLVNESAPGNVYKNFNIWAGTKKIKDARLRYKIENTWLESNGLAGSDMKILRWSENRWQTLDIAEIKNDGTYTFVEADTPGFSSFVLTGLKGGLLPALTPIATQQPEETSTTSGTATITQTPTSEAPPVNLAIVMLVIVLIAIVAVVYIKRKEIFKK
ncbi:PGF-pre-PGF domain-containing protein [Candidatus Methanoperedens nitratireducens]|uniref:PGF-pre-PGF domain-containing protein n=1 Tax=Candidatus Methanoperedens nitratireducens TaxID=1392998 RepID=UPI000BB699D7|nr:PGF-pre-PGF domain-containing protein [Candidatus Methanoperedens nitroreducens]